MSKPASRNSKIVPNKKKSANDSTARASPHKKSGSSSLHSSMIKNQDKQLKLISSHSARYLSKPQQLVSQAHSDRECESSSPKTIRLEIPEFKQTQRSSQINRDQTEMIKKSLISNDKAQSLARQEERRIATQRRAKYIEKYGPKSAEKNQPVKLKLVSKQRESVERLSTSKMDLSDGSIDLTGDLFLKKSLEDPFPLPHSRVQSRSMTPLVASPKSGCSNDEIFLSMGSGAKPPLSKRLAKKKLIVAQSLPQLSQERKNGQFSSFVGVPGKSESLRASVASLDDGKAPPEQVSKGEQEFSSLEEGTDSVYLRVKQPKGVNRSLKEPTGVYQSLKEPKNAYRSLKEPKNAYRSLKEPKNVNEKHQDRVLQTLQDPQVLKGLRILGGFSRFLEGRRFQSFQSSVALYRDIWIV